MACEECGSDNVTEAELEGFRVLECELCGALAGNDAAVSRVLLAREARDHGVDPAIYPLVLLLRGLPGIQVVGSSAGDVEMLTWPFVQLALSGPDAVVSLENLAKSLTLSAPGGPVHWVVELEYQTRLVLALKPRFHTDVDRITAASIEAARGDLERIRSNLERDMRLSWWRHSSPA